MNRVAKIIIYALVLFLLYLWINSIAKSCNNRDNIESITISSFEDEVGYSSDEEIYDEFFESDSETSEDGKESTTDEEVVDEDDEEAFDEDFSFESKEKKPIAKPATKSTTKAVETSKPVARTSSQNSSGKYTIVAGSYLIRDNAEKMVSRLKKMGYNNAAILNFDGSQYHTISAGQFASYDDASAGSAGLKSKGIDCYVHTRK